MPIESNTTSNKAPEKGTEAAPVNQTAANLLKQGDKNYSEGYRTVGIAQQQKAVEIVGNK